MTAIYMTIRPDSIHRQRIPNGWRIGAVTPQGLGGGTNLILWKGEDLRR